MSKNEAGAFDKILVVTDDFLLPADEGKEATNMTQAEDAIEELANEQLDQDAEGSIILGVYKLVKVVKVTKSTTQKILYSAK